MRIPGLSINKNMISKFKTNPHLKESPALWCLISVVAFHLANLNTWLAPLMIVFFFGLIKTSQLGSARTNFYRGLAIGLLIYAWQLRFFLNIFSEAAVVLWLILAFWIGLFMVLANHYQRSRNMALQILLLVSSWMTLEYFRGELYYLKFTWITPGMAFSPSDALSSIGWMGVYGLSTCCLAIASLSLLFEPAKRLDWVWGSTLVTGMFLVLVSAPSPSHNPSSHTIEIGGVHVDDPGSANGLLVLERFMDQHPQTELIVLAEYAFLGEPPESLREWCRSRRVHLVAGGTQPLPDDTYFNTAFVISPQGEIVHKQAKSVPIQFFKDGLPAQEQDVWQSPWGPIGICICYDLSYTRVTDGLIRKGATMILVPTLDELHWGKSQHLLHSRIAPMRSAEYRVPIVRVGACGISQAVDEGARVIASTSFPGEGATLHAKLSPSQHARIPMDRFWVWIAGPVVLAELLASGYVRSTKCSATREPPARIV